MQVVGKTHGFLKGVRRLQQEQLATVKLETCTLMSVSHLHAKSHTCRRYHLTHFHCRACLSEPGNAEQPGVGVRAHRQATSASVLLRRPDRALLSAPAAAAAAAPRPSRSRSNGQQQQQQQQYPGPRPELRPHPGQRRGPTDGHNPGGHQRLSPGRGGPVRRLPNRRSLLVGYEILLRGSDRSDTAAQGPAAPKEAGVH